MRAPAKVPPLPPFSPSNPFKTLLVPPGRLRRPKRLGDEFYEGKFGGGGRREGAIPPTPCPLSLLPPPAFCSPFALRRFPSQEPQNKGSLYALEVLWGGRLRARPSPTPIYFFSPFTIRLPTDSQGDRNGVWGAPFFFKILFYF